MQISAIWLRRIGNDVIVSFERDGVWRRAIVEAHDASFSHIVELDITGNGPSRGNPRPVEHFKEESL